MAEIDLPEAWTTNAMPSNVWYTLPTTTSSSTSLTIPSAAWDSWTSNISAGTVTIAYERVWPNWVERNGRFRAVRRASPESVVRSASREADVERRLRDIRLRRHSDYMRRREERHIKADRLLHRFLTSEEKSLMRRERLLHVIGSDGKRYEIDTTKDMHNVFELDDNGKRVVEHCIYLPGVPQGDNILGQKMLLENDAAEFRRIANQTRLLRIA